MGKPKRGISAYSYGEFGVSMTLEDILADISDIGAPGLEILSNTHIYGYPNPTEAWLDDWDRMIEQYGLVPVEYGHWVDARLYEGRELSTAESVEALQLDIRLAHRLGFSILRTKLGVIEPVDGVFGFSVRNWEAFIREVLPMAEDYNVRLCPEIHMPIRLGGPVTDEYVNFIERTGTKHFGLNVDFSVFEPLDTPEAASIVSRVEDMLPLLPYIYCCHAKVYHMDEQCRETRITNYPEILRTLMDQGWDGYLISEYEGKPRNVIGQTSQQLRRHHYMMKQILGA